MSGNIYWQIGPTASDHTITFDDSGALEVDGNPLGSPNMGWVQVTANNVTESGLVYATNLVSPKYVPEQGNVIASESSYMSDWSPLNLLAASDSIVVTLTSFLASGLWDTVGVAGTVLVWDLVGANLLECTYISGAMSNGTVVDAATLTQVQRIGTDLTLTDTNTSITSTAGGVYNVLINAAGAWS